MEAYRSKKSESEKQRERIEKTERRRFEQSKGDFIARFVEVLDNLDRAIDSIEDSFDADASVRIADGRGHIQSMEIVGSVARLEVSDGSDHEEGRSP